MSRKILVLDAFTNGHEACLSFIKKQGWLESECEIVFCGNHQNIFDRLVEGPAYAVVPIYNSIALEVTEVTNNLSKLADLGYELEERDRLLLQINHCLMAHRSIGQPEELECVMSHEKAIQQCGKFLDSIGVTPDKRSKRDSTGNAARAVSKTDAELKFGAIAPRAAADEYGLKVLAEKIQDVPDNKTTFLLLENRAEVKSKTVGIIGFNGRFGQFLKRFFEGLGCKVIGAGRNLNDKIATVKQSDVVIISVSIRDTPEVIRSVLPYFREDQLLMDVTSIKQPAVKAMLESKAQVVGLHPMFRPDGSFDGQTVVVCPMRLTNSWKTWVVNMLAATGSNIKYSTPIEHDGQMTTVQVNPHLGNLASALLITETGISVTESLAFTSPFYRIMFSLMGRLVGQSPDLYTDIVMENPQTLVMLERRITIEQRLLELIKRKDRTGFEALFMKAKEHFGPEVIHEANELFMRILGVLNTLYGKNSAILEFTLSQSQPGLLARISGVFSNRQVNLTGINSVILDGQRVQFAISFEQSRSSDAVRRALEDIDNWEDLKVTIIG
jgi:prephenate dehydrogenase